MQMAEECLKKINAERLIDGLWQLLNVPSPTGNERKAVLEYAELLKDAGMVVELDGYVPESPGLIARLKGNRPGKCIQLAGHIDHIDKPHPEPKREKDIVSGRGSADMKNGLAGILEGVRVLKESGCNFPGEVIVTVYGHHETPVGNQKPLIHMLENGIKGDGAIVAESFSDLTVVAAKGQAIWNILLSRQGQICHEISRGPDMDNLLEAAVRVVNAILRKNNELSVEPHKYDSLGPETLFIGQVHYGDFYNRVPKECKLQGTYRWHPDHSFESVQKDLAETLDKLDIPANVSLDLSWVLSGESYEVDPSESVIQALHSSCKAITEKKWQLGGTSVVTDACRIARVGNIPVGVLSFGSDRAHADYEFVKIDDVLCSTKILLRAVLDYLHRTEGNK